MHVAVFSPNFCCHPTQSGKEAMPRFGSVQTSGPNMGGSDSKLHFRKAVIQLTTRTQAVDASDDTFWDQFWSDTSTSVQDVFALVPAAEIRALREESPSNLATLCYKAVEKLVRGAECGCPSPGERQVVLNCTRLLTRVLPFIYEDADWRGFFWSSVPGAARTEEEDDDDDGGGGGDEGRPLAESLLLAIADLLFCPHFTIKTSVQEVDTKLIDSCEHIWEAGVGFAQSPPLDSSHDSNRAELLKLLLTCFSEVLYLPPPAAAQTANTWVVFFCSSANRHALPLFTSLVNVVCAYDPAGWGVPYNHLLFSDQRQLLVEQALQVLIVTLDQGTTPPFATDAGPPPSGEEEPAPGAPENLFVNYLSRIHREEDLRVVLKGVVRLLNNPLVQTFLPLSSKKIHFHQELLVLFWKICHFNKKFLFFLLKSSEVLDLLIPILFFLNRGRADPTCVGLLHVGVFILLLLSGERNFGVRLNKPFALRVPMDVPVFSGTHADLLVLTVHRMMTSGQRRLQPLFDCMLTVVVNVSPYLKSLSMVASNKLLHLLEVFSSPRFLFCARNHHQLVFLLLEVFNNIIQYQFDGNSNLVYALIRKRNLFYQLASLPADAASIQKALQKKRRKSGKSGSNSPETESSLRPPADNAAAEASTPGMDRITDKSQTEEDNMAALEPDCSAIAGLSDTESNSERDQQPAPSRPVGSHFPAGPSSSWSASPDWVLSWRSKLPLQTIMRLLQVLVPQVEKICIDKALTDESEILKFLQHGTLVGLLPVPHPILIRKSQVNPGTSSWFRTYVWGVVYLRNVDPPVWYDTDIRLFEIQRT
ncbi:protein HID1-like isoform X2 [Nerophis ophidion]|uniref:protein HID1-like isoform X2 n=1 Tax=Nerophis ophidion TaxID=159077 RepID=UPI002ADF96CD|nr:protein HID1-like isoform X2 [Nerophis ophidion]